jgi:hypothetical protein
MSGRGRPAWLTHIYPSFTFCMGSFMYLFFRRLLLKQQIVDDTEKVICLMNATMLPGVKSCDRNLKSNSRDTFFATLPGYSLQVSPPFWCSPASTSCGSHAKSPTLTGPFAPSPPTPKSTPGTTTSSFSGVPSQSPFYQTKTSLPGDATRAPDQGSAQCSGSGSRKKE